MPEITLSNATLTSVATRKNLDNQEHLVIPVVAIKTGVLNDIFYSEKEIKTFSQAWNGVPIPVAHPERNGVKVSANAPEFDDTVNIGKFFNADFSDGKLKGEIWINIEKARRLGYGDLIDHFNAGKMMEVSTGLFSEQHSVKGQFNNQGYSYVAKNIRPDHIALLPNEKGACSIEDGCGAMRTNNGECGCDACIKKELETLSLPKKIATAIKGLGDLFKQQAITEGLAVNTEQSKMEKEALVKALIANKASGLEEKDEKALLSLDIDILKRMVANYEKENPKQPSVNELVTALIANKSNSLEKKDEKALILLGEDTLKRMLANDEKEAKEKEEEAINQPSDNSLKGDDLVLFNRLKEKENKRVEEIRKIVKEGYKHLSDDVIANMTVEAIEGLAEGIKPTSSFVGRLGGGSHTDKKPIKTHRAILLGNLNNKEKEKENESEEK